MDIREVAGDDAVGVTRGPADVAVLPCDGDYRAVIPRLVSLAGAEGIVGPGDSVLIKPNLHAPQHWRTGGTTNPALVGALIDWARARGATRILVADSPFRGNQRPEEVFTTTGMAEAVEQKGAEWALPTSHPFRTFEGASPHLPRQLGISELLLACDTVINVALMKTHLNCLVSLGMKNLKGCIRNRDKAAFHQDVDIDRAIVALNQLIRPDLTIVDGTLGMEGIGPGGGTPARFGHIFAGLHAPAVDAVAAGAMGVEIHEARSLKIAVEEGLLQPEGIRGRGEQMSGMRQRFERPDEAMARELPDLQLQADGACSGCRLNVVTALRDLARSGGAPPDPPIVIGKEPPSQGRALLIGDCALAHRDGHECLPGCAPRSDTIRAFLEQHA
ncbi:MAG: DUF362 domain-containing protein [Armatimonadota bacterium]